MPVFTPSGQVGNITTEADFLNLIVNLHLANLSDLEALIPIGTAQSWAARPDDHIKFGVKYQWSDFATGRRRMVRIHEPDTNAPYRDGGDVTNSTLGWIVRIQVGNRYICSGNPAFSARNVNANGNASHIPVLRSAQNMATLHLTAQMATADTRVSRGRRVGQLDAARLAVFRH